VIIAARMFVRSPSVKQRKSNSESGSSFSRDIRKEVALENSAHEDKIQ
jgi:hypothetical protein